MPDRAGWWGRTPMLAGYRPWSGSSPGQQASPSGVLGDLRAVQIGRTDDAGECAPRVRRDRVLVVQPRRVDDERVVRGEDGEVGVVAQRDPPLAPQPGQ